MRVPREIREYLCCLSFYLSIEIIKFFAELIREEIRAGIPHGSAEGNKRIFVLF